MPGPVVPDDDLYARLGVAADASPETIELAWRGLLRRHHPDVAGDDAGALELAKRINVAHDWLADPELRRRYDRARGAPRGRTGVRPGTRPRARRAPAAPPRTDLRRGDPDARLGRLLDRAARLAPDERDRLAAAERAPIAFHATVHRFLPSEALDALAAAEAALARRVSPAAWADPGVREALLAAATECVAAPFLDEVLDEPFRLRAQERLLRAWEAAVDQPRLGPNGPLVAALAARARTLGREGAAAFLRASRGVDPARRPPEVLDPEDDEALRVSAALAAADLAGAVPEDAWGLPPASAARLRRLLARLGHLAALRHVLPAGEWAAAVAPWTAATGSPDPAAAPPAAPRPDVRRAR